MQDYSEIAQSLKDFMTKTGKKQSGICKTMDVSQTALSQFLSGQYQGDNESLAEKIKNILLMRKPRLICRNRRRSL